MINDTLYTSTSLSQVAAIDAVTGTTKWVFDPKIYENGLGIPANDGWLHRGVVCVEAATGKKIWHYQLIRHGLWDYDTPAAPNLIALPLPANATGSPITYMAGGKQYIVFPVGGGPLVEELLAVAL